MSRSRILTAVLGLSTLLAVPAGAQGTEPAPESNPPGRAVAKRTEPSRLDWERAAAMGDDLAVVEVVAVAKAETDNAHPPTVEVRLLQLLHGDKSVDRSRLVWGPDYTFGISCGKDQRIQEWRTSPFTEWPRVGERFIVALTPANRSGVPYSPGQCREPFSEAALSEIRGWWEEVRTLQEELAAERAAESRRRIETAQAFWRTKASEADFERLLGGADLVATARIASGPRSQLPGFQVLQLLRSPAVGPDGGAPGTISVPCPAGWESALQPELTFLLILRMRGASTPWNATAVGALFEGDQGIFELNETLLDSAGRHVKAHPVPAEAERETIARCRAWSAARNAEEAFAHPHSGLTAGPGSQEHPLHQQDPVLAERVERMESILKRWPEADASRARLDPQLRAALGRWLIRHARVVTLRSTGLDARGGTPEAIDPELSRALLGRAIRLVRAAAETGTVTRAELESDPELAALHGQDGWGEILASLAE